MNVLCNTPENEQYLLSNPKYHFNSLAKVLSTVTDTEKKDSTLLIKTLS